MFNTNNLPQLVNAILRGFARDKFQVESKRSNTASEWSRFVGDLMSETGAKFEFDAIEGKTITLTLIADPDDPRDDED